MICALVPVKRLGEAKSRLAGHLESGLREEMVLDLMSRVVEALMGTVDEVCVISPDSRVLQAALAAGALPLHSEEPLNPALETGRAWALRHGATRVMVVLGDLPLLTEADVRAIVARPGIVMAPDRHNRGTNVLLLSPPDAINFAFGPDSFPRHQALARERGYAVSIYRSESSGLDVDCPEDLAALR
ncbi:MAG: 2-phospho-L-lactate guanylyltransferase [Candidatus Xenobia bacterium]